ncbi:MAG: hypothetical protein K0A99_10075 [Desulfoarculaceae bacterium]|nr:hypothetical protein [Desulfoarculaceae bacterium]
MKKAQQKIDKILAAVCKRTQDEVSGLIGASFILAAPHSLLISKEDAFEQLSGKQVLAKMDVTGEVQGHGCLLLELKDAIRLGGTLIMLPDDALEEMVSAGEYNEDAEDSYGEIANIIAGSYTKVFEEMYPQNCRFVRKTHEVIIPVKVDAGSDEPVPDQLYYQVNSAMKLGDRQMGNLVMLLPAASFGLEGEVPAVVEAASPAAAQAPPATPAPLQQENPVAEAAEEPVQAEPSPVAEALPPVQEVVADFDVRKHQKRIDALLDLCRQKLGAEMGALLGVEVELSEQECRLVTKEDYFLDDAPGKQILARLNVVGEVEDNGYLLVALKDAVFIGGTLIMLPPTELERAVIDEEFGEDIEDAYGEIANIMSGVYSSIFEEQYIKKIRFVKTGLERVLALKVDTESEAPLPNQLYYMSSSSLTIAGKSMGKVQMLFPATMLQLDGVLQQEAAPPVAPRVEQAAATSSAGEVKSKSADYRSIEILVVSDDAREAAKITEVLEQRHLSAKVLSFKDSVTDYLPGEVKAIFLVMSTVNEKAFSVAIKISAACSLPLIAAGPGWTRTKVRTAVKYGVNDILLTPATSDEVGEKIENISVKLAA